MIVHILGVEWMDTKKLSLASSCPIHTRNMHDSWSPMCLVCKNMYLGFIRHIYQASGQIREKKCNPTFVILAFTTCCWFNLGDYFLTALFAIFLEVAFSSLLASVYVNMVSMWWLLPQQLRIWHFKNSNSYLFRLLKTAKQDPANEVLKIKYNGVLKAKDRATFKTHNAKKHTRHEKVVLMKAGFYVAIASWGKYTKMSFAKWHCQQPERNRIFSVCHQCSFSCTWSFTWRTSPSQAVLECKYVALPLITGHAPSNIISPYLYNSSICSKSTSLGKNR